MDTYNCINNFPYNSRFLFVDIFARNNELVLIIPNYNNDFVKDIKCIYGSQSLPIKKEIAPIPINDAFHNHFGTTFILIYELDIGTSKFFTVDVMLYDTVKSYTLQHMMLQKDTILSATTLFKDDHFLLNKYINYYTNQGCQKFYLYYNDNKEKFKNTENVTFIEWNYPYFVDGIKAIAQSTQLNHSLYKYGLVSTQYMIFNDLDEYMTSPNQPLIKLIESNKSFDSFIFANRWADTIDIPTDLNEYFKQLKNDANLPKQFLADKNSFPYGNRSKCIHKTDSIYFLQNIHLGEYYTNTKNVYLSGLTMYHFFRWSPEYDTERSKLRGRVNIKSTRDRTDPEINFYNFEIKEI